MKLNDDFQSPSTRLRDHLSHRFIVGSHNYPLPEAVPVEGLWKAAIRKRQSPRQILKFLNNQNSAGSAAVTSPNQRAAN